MSLLILAWVYNSDEADDITYLLSCRTHSFCYLKGASDSLKAFFMAQFQSCDIYPSHSRPPIFLGVSICAIENQEGFSLADQGK